MYFQSATIEMAAYLCMTLIASVILRFVEKKMDGDKDYELAIGINDYGLRDAEKSGRMRQAQNNRNGSTRGER